MEMDSPLPELLVIKDLKIQILLKKVFKDFFILLSLTSITFVLKENLSFFSFLSFPFFLLLSFFSFLFSPFFFLLSYLFYLNSLFFEKNRVGFCHAKDCKTTCDS